MTLRTIGEKQNCIFCRMVVTNSKEKYHQECFDAVKEYRINSPLNWLYTCILCFGIKWSRYSICYKCNDIVREQNYQEDMIIHTAKIIHKLKGCVICTSKKKMHKVIVDIELNQSMDHCLCFECNYTLELFRRSEVSQLLDIVIKLNGI